MRIRRLTLDRFGHFTEKRFDFGDRPETGDFHIIYGPNEAGKTTTMEGFLKLLYGFKPREEPYDFRHGRANLRLTAEVQTESASQTFVRLPRSLTGADGTAVPETALSAHLGGLDEAAYRSLLCLDDATIESGGEEIARAQGDIGKLLFSASSGISALSDVLGGVRDEADALYLKRGRKTQMAALKDEAKEIRDRLQALDVSASSYRKMRKALDAAKAAEDSARQALSDCQSALAKARATAAALPLLVQCDALSGRVEAGKDYPESLDIDPESLVALLTRQAEVQAAKESAEKDRIALAEKLAALQRNPDADALTQALADLAPLHAAYQGAQRDLDKRLASCAETETKMRRIAEGLGLPSDLPLEALTLSSASLSGLESARTAVLDAQKALTTEQDEVASLTAEISAAKARLQDHSSAVQDISELLETHAADLLAPRHATASEAIAAAEQAARARLDQLALGGVTFDALPAAAMTAEAAQTLSEALTEAERRRADAQERLDTCETDLQAAQRRIAHLQDSSRLLDDAALGKALAQRDALWQTHLDTLSSDSAARFHDAMHRVDMAQTARLAAADRLADLRAAEAEILELVAARDTLRESLRQRDEALSSLKGQLRAACDASGLPVGTDALSYAGWVRRHEEASRAVSHLSQTRQTHAKTLADAAALAKGLRQALGLATDDVDTLLAKARAAASQEQTQAQMRDRHEEALQKAHQALDARRKRHDAAATQLRTARQAWESRLAETLPIAPETLLPSLEPLRSLRELGLSRDDILRRIETMTGDKDRFAAAVSDFAIRFSLPQDSAEVSHRALRAEAERAAQAETQFALLSDQQKALDRTLSDADRDLAAIAAQVETLGAVFTGVHPVASLSDLRAAVSRAQDAIEARREQARLGSEITAQLGVASLTEARSLLGDLTPAEAQATLDAAETAVGTAQTDLEQAVAARSAATQALGAVSSDAEVARLHERRMTLELAQEDVALRHLTLALGHKLADRALRRYRDTHRSGMMADAERAFAELTEGAYPRLGAQPEGGADVLMAFDQTGAAKRAAEMSKGTRFQLYLALRAAAYEQMSRNGLTLPFFCDDVFETFDEARTSAACRLMERIGRTGQAIYLTHHKHVVEIARTVCQQPPIIHEITRADSGIMRELDASDVSDR